MKRSLILLISMTGLSAFASAPSAPQHPLSAVVLSLADTSKQLSILSESASSDQTIKNEAQKLRQGVSLLTKRSLLAPMIGLDVKLASFGYVLSKTPMETYESVADTNANYAQLIKDAYDLNLGRWLELKNTLDNDRRVSRVIAKFAAQGDVTNALSSPKDLQAVQSLATGRTAPIDNIEEAITVTIDCMNYVSKAFDTTGLRIVEVTAGKYEFSVPDLKRVYNVSKIDELNRAQKSHVAGLLTEIATKVFSYERACMPQPEITFINNTVKSLNR